MRSTRPSVLVVRVSFGERPRYLGRSPSEPRPFGFQPEVELGRDLMAMIINCIFIAVWVILFVLGCVWIRRHPWRVVLLPAIAAAILFGGLRAGTTLLGWAP